MSLNEQVVRAASSAHPRPLNTTFAYGTAGFRANADTLDSTMFRVGLLAALRSKKLAGQHIGVMVTASHNPEQDNGVKLVDPHGEMLHSSWEQYATLLANATSDDALVTTLHHVIQATGVDLAVKANVVYGHDTRPSCRSLVRAVVDGLAALDTDQVNAGLVTTPQLHYLVRCLNTQGSSDAYGEPSVEGYYHKLAAAYTTLATGRHLLPALTVDCANGVGAPKLKEFLKVVGTDLLPLVTVRDTTTVAGSLNKDCGADFVKTQQRAPRGVDLVPWQRYASFDGDADRIVFYYADAEGTFHLLDGDKIAGLVAGFILDLVRDAGLDDVKVGVVQTAYANGASTKYLTEVLGVPVTCVPTGVKHLHHAAESYDVGVYFEANGHGTVLFSPATLSLLSSPGPSSPTASQSAALSNLRALVDLINQTVGDALSDLLLVETILLHRQWSPAQWDSAYSDLPNRLVKVLVTDRTAFVTSDAERRLDRPEGVQARIDEAVRGVEGGRSFVRPSGTEDCVRVYAEANTRQAADGASLFLPLVITDPPRRAAGLTRTTPGADLANKVARIVHDKFGKGPQPASFF
ncbi:Phosphoacetylglucosamine mutase [Rhodotorula diobovata]|uniref:Phosphoacetylglucosamine mutase n=1 Tax=Rhodotorula diobovata TaxID=5288 RepID=A0A5C5G134_9BASI|nr:Phosphoacetylglucosamine mutase [Rhodotorula diobovata]